MTESGAIVVAIITAVQGITIALIGVLAVRVGRVRKDASATKDQIVNHHPTNFRVENDKRHSETIRWFKRILGKIGEQADAISALTSRVSSLEDTRDIEEIRKELNNNG